MHRLLLAGAWPALLLAAPPVFVPLPTAPYSASASVGPENARIFTSSYEGGGTTVAEQVAEIYERFGRDLAVAGLGPADVVNVRGYLKAAPGESLDEAMRQWNDAFLEFFGRGEATPTRTTIGVTALQNRDSLLAADFVLAAPPGIERAEPRLANARVADLGTGWSVVAPFTPLLITSGTLADPVKPDSTEFGPMARQTTSTLEKLSGVLASWGLDVRDLVFVRALLSPPPAAEGEAPAGADDFAGFSTAWHDFWAKQGTDTPPLSQFAAPGFNASGRLVEIEYYAAFPDAMGPFRGADTPGPILREGSESSFLSRSVAVSRTATLVWFAGVIDQTRASLEGQGVNALLTLGERMEAPGVTFSGIVQLRAYLQIEGDFRREFDSWNTAYRRFFDHAVLNPTKPVRTAFPIEALPGGVRLEIELLGVAEPPQ